MLLGFLWIRACVAGKTTVSGGFFFSFSAHEDISDESLINEVLTPNKNYITYCGSSIKCKIRAFYAATDEIKHLGGRVRCMSHHHIEDVNVLRSSGVVEKHWKFEFFVWPAKESVYARGSNHRLGLEKGCHIKDFIDVNPNFSRSITLLKTNFDDPKLLQQLQDSFEAAQIRVKWEYQNISDFVGVVNAALGA